MQLALHLGLAFLNEALGGAAEAPAFWNYAAANVLMMTQTALHACSTGGHHWGKK
jgi:hypothetical protein